MKSIKKKPKKYLEAFIKKYPELSSGRKNYVFIEDRIKKNIKLILKFKRNLLNTKND